MSSELIPFFVVLGLLLLYPICSAVRHFRLRELKARLAEDRCPTCQAVFGPSLASTVREFNGLVDPTPNGPLLKFICPHCHSAWEYSGGSYTHVPS